MGHRRSDLTTLRFLKFNSWDSAFVSTTYYKLLLFQDFFINRYLLSIFYKLRYPSSSILIKRIFFHKVIITSYLVISPYTRLLHLFFNYFFMFRILGICSLLFLFYIRFFLYVKTNQYASRFSPQLPRTFFFYKTGNVLCNLCLPTVRFFYITVVLHILCMLYFSCCLNYYFYSMVYSLLLLTFNVFGFFMYIQLAYLATYNTIVVLYPHYISPVLTSVPFNTYTLFTINVNLYSTRLLFLLFFFQTVPYWLGTIFLLLSINILRARYSALLSHKIVVAIPTQEAFVTNEYFITHTQAISIGNKSFGHFFFNIVFFLIQFFQRTHRTFFVFYRVYTFISGYFIRFLFPLLHIGTKKLSTQKITKKKIVKNPKIKNKKVSVSYNIAKPVTTANRNSTYRQMRQYHRTNTSIQVHTAYYSSVSIRFAHVYDRLFLYVSLFIRFLVRARVNFFNQRLLYLLYTYTIVLFLYYYVRYWYYHLLRQQLHILYTRLHNMLALHGYVFLYKQIMCAIEMCISIPHNTVYLIVLSMYKHILVFVKYLLRHLYHIFIFSSAYYHFIVYLFYIYFLQTKTHQPIKSSVQYITFLNSYVKKQHVLTCRHQKVIKSAAICKREQSRYPNKTVLVTHNKQHKIKRDGITGVFSQTRKFTTKIQVIHGCSVLLNTCTYRNYTASKNKTRSVDPQDDVATAINKNYTDVHVTNMPTDFLLSTVVKATTYHIKQFARNSTEINCRETFHYGVNSYSQFFKRYRRAVLRRTANIVAPRSAYASAFSFAVHSKKLVCTVYKNACIRSLLCTNVFSYVLPTNSAVQQSTVPFYFLYLPFSMHSLYMVYNIPTTNIRTWWNKQRFLTSMVFLSYWNQRRLSVRRCYILNKFFNFFLYTQFNVRYITLCQHLTACTMYCTYAVEGIVPTFIGAIRLPILKIQKPQYNVGYALFLLTHTILNFLQVRGGIYGSYSYVQSFLHSTLDVYNLSTSMSLINTSMYIRCDLSQRFTPFYNITILIFTLLWIYLTYLVLSIELFLLYSSLFFTQPHITTYILQTNINAYSVLAERFYTLQLYQHIIFFYKSCTVYELVVKTDHLLYSYFTFALNLFFTKKLSIGIYSVQHFPDYLEHVKYIVFRRRALYRILYTLMTFIIRSLVLYTFRYFILLLEQSIMHFIQQTVFLLLSFHTYEHFPLDFFFNRLFFFSAVRFKNISRLHLLDRSLQQLSTVYRTKQHFYFTFISAKALAEFVLMKFEYGYSIQSVFAAVKFLQTSEHVRINRVRYRYPFFYYRSTRQFFLDGLRIILYGPRYKAQRRTMFAYHLWIGAYEYTQRMPLQTFGADITYYTLTVIRPIATLSIHVFILSRYFKVRGVLQ